MKERKTAAREVARQYVLDYLANHPCAQCGESDPRVLEFHHQGNKEKGVAYLVGGGWSVVRIQEEIDKCIVLCANCHRKLTVEERGWFKKKR